MPSLKVSRDRTWVGRPTCPAIGQPRHGPQEPSETSQHPQKAEREKNKERAIRIAEHNRDGIRGEGISTIVAQRAQENGQLWTVHETE